MLGFFEFADGIGSTLFPILTTILIILVVYIIFNFFLGLLKKSLLKLAKTKKQISNAEIFTAAIRYVFLFLLLISAIFYYSGGWTELALTLGLFSAAVGFALQKPISGVAAWVMIATRRPFEIGDRVIIGNVKGDVRDISLTHITLNELGGLVQTEENSGRRIMVPNNLLFEQNIVNYTQQDEFILHQVIVSITYESNLDKAMKLCTNVAKKQTKQFSESKKKEPYVRIFFQPNGINLSVRFFVPAKRITEFASSITRDIYSGIRKAKDVSFAYPHTEVLLRSRGGKKVGEMHP
jgi:small-conductance mechanosensitive channel